MQNEYDVMDSLHTLDIFSYSMLQVLGKNTEPLVNHSFASFLRFIVSYVVMKLFNLELRRRGNCVTGMALNFLNSDARGSTSLDIAKNICHKSPSVLNVEGVASM